MAKISGKNSPNLVTLPLSHKGSPQIKFFQCQNQIVPLANVDKESRVTTWAYLPIKKGGF
jgi:hypothetical protein